MTDTRNTQAMIEVAHKALSRRSAEMRSAARYVADEAQEHGFTVTILVLCDAVLIAARDTSVRAAKHKGDGPAGGDLDRQANALLGLYEQLRAAYEVAQREGT